MGFPRPEYWSGLPFPSPGDLFNPRTEPGSLTLQEISCNADGFFTVWATMVMVLNGLRKGNWQSWNVLTVSCPFCYWILVSTLVYPVYVSHSVVSDSVTPWTVACQAPLSMEFSRQEYWSGQPFPTPGDLPDPGIKPMSAASPTLAGRFFTLMPPRKPNYHMVYRYLSFHHKTSSQYYKDVYPRVEVE